MVQHKFAEARAGLLVMLQFKPDDVKVMNDLAWVLATCSDADVRDGQQAVQFAERACELTGYQQAVFVGTLAAAYAETSQFPAAVKAAQQARDVAEANGQSEVARRNEELLKLYGSGRAYHEEK